MSIGKRLALILLVLTGGVTCDRITKAAAQIYLSPTEVKSFCGDTFRLQLARNQGAFLSLGAYLPDFWRHLFFNVGVGAMLLGLLGYALFSQRIRPEVFWAAALLLAGGVGNLWDRLVYDGNVVDFMNFGIGPVRTGIVNVADILITLAVLLLLFYSFRRRKRGF